MLQNYFITLLGLKFVKFYLIISISPMGTQIANKKIIPTPYNGGWPLKDLSPPPPNPIMRSVYAVVIESIYISRF